MTTDQELNQTHYPSRPTSDSVPSGAGRTKLAAAGLALGAATVATALVIKPWGDRDEFGYADLAPHRDGIWVGTLADGFALALVGVTLALVVLGVVRRRGSRLAEVGAVMTVVGGIAFAMGSFAHGAGAWFATSDAISTDAGTALLQRVEDTPERLLVVVMVGFGLYTLGSLALASALIRARVAPRLLPIGFVVLTLAQFSPVPERILDFIQVVLMALLVVMAGLVVARRFEATA